MPLNVDFRGLPHLGVFDPSADFGDAFDVTHEWARAYKAELEHHRVPGTPYLYVATVYSQHEVLHDDAGSKLALYDAYLMAGGSAAAIASAFGLPVFCPITNGHLIGQRLRLQSGDDAHRYWMWFDMPFLLNAAALLIVQHPRLDRSRGISEELYKFWGYRKVCEPDQLPSVLLVDSTNHNQLRVRTALNYHAA